MGRASRTKSARRAIDGEVGRSPTGSERRALARRRASRRRLLRYAIPSGILAVVVAVALALSLGGGGSPGAPATTGRVTVAGPPIAQPLAKGSLVPDFSAPGLGGGTVAWGDRAGKPAVLAVWTPWCPSCQKEMPVLDRLADDFPAVALLTVVTAADLHPGPTTEEYMRGNALAFPVALDDDSGTLGSALGIDGFPTVYYVGRDGAVVATQVGEWEEERIRAAFRQISGS